MSWMNSLHASKSSSSDNFDHMVNVNKGTFQCFLWPVHVIARKKKNCSHHMMSLNLCHLWLISKVIYFRRMLLFVCVSVWITEYKRRNLFCISCQNTIFNTPWSCLWKINLQNNSPLQSFTEDCYSQILMHINTSEFVQYIATLSLLPLGSPSLYRLDNAWVTINSRK